MTRLFRNATRWLALAVLLGVPTTLCAQTAIDHTTFTAAVTATATDITLTAASPAISCLPDSIVHIDHATISDSSLGLFATSSSCRLTNSSLQNVYDGIVTIDTNIPMSNTTIWAVRHDIRKITTH